MQTRDLLTLSLVLALAASVGFVLIGDDSHATALPPAPDEPEAAAPEQSEQPDGPEGPAAPATAASGGVPVAAVASGQGGRTVDTSGWKTGVIRGDIRLAVSVLDKIESMTVIVEELRAAIDHSGRFEPPHKIIVPVERGVGTPTFEVRNVPFSVHPYAVSVYSPGLNGGRRTLTVDAQTPLHEDVVLSITPGRPFSVLVRDQDSNPYPFVEVRLFPVGAPSGRKEHIGSTDGYGAAVFESVLAGDYRIVTGQNGVPLAEPEIVTVQATARVYGNKIQGQGHTVVVERGVPLEIWVGDKASYGVADAKVRLQATDRVRLTVIEKVSDGAGKVVFPHLTPGKWMVTITKQDFQPWTRQITIADGEVPEPLRPTLARLR